MKNGSRSQPAIYVAILMLLFCIPYSLTAQNSDSILSVFKSHKTNDTTKVILIDQIAFNYQKTNIDSAIRYANEGLSISQSIAFEKGQALCLRELGYSYLQKSEYAKALADFNRSLIDFKATENKDGEASILKYIGNVYYRESEYDSAFEYYNNSLRICDQIHDNKTSGLVLMNIGIIYSDLGNYPKALEFYQRSLDLFEKEKYLDGVALCLSNIALVYSGNGDYNKAIDYNNQCQSIYERTGDKVGILSTIVNTAVIYGEMNDDSDALMTFKKGYVLASSIGEDYWKKICSNDIAESSYQLGNYDTALVWYKYALAASETAKEPYNIAAARNGIGNVLIKQGKVDEGTKELLIAYDIVQKNGIKEMISQTAIDLSKAYELEHDYAHALEYYKIYSNYKDSLYNEKNEKRFHQLQFDDELGKKDTQIKLLEKDKMFRQKIFITAVIMLIMAVTIVILLFVNYQKSKKNLRTLTLLKNELEKKNREQDRVLDVVTHDLRSPVSGVISLADILLTERIAPEDAEQSVRIIKNTSQSALTLINELMGYRNKTKDDLSKEPVDINMLTKEVIRLLQLKANEKQQQLHAHIPSTSLIISADREKTGRILTNLIGNAIKFSNNGANIDISLENTGQSVLITVKDHGIGIPDALQGHIFELFTESKRKGTAGEKSYGLGLSIAQQIVTAHGGKIWFESEQGRGTTFYVQLFF